MYAFIIIFHVIFCILLVSIVLLQVGRGRGMLGFLGGGAVENLFGSRAGDVLTKGTTIVAVFFMVTSLTLAYLSVKKGSSIMSGKPFKIQQAPLVNGKASDTKGHDKLTQKTADIVDKVKDTVYNFIPRLTKGQEPQDTAKPNPSVTTKSKINYDGKGNKTVNELKYDSEGNLVGHTQTTYDKLGKETDKKELPLEESEPEKSTEPIPTQSEE